ncbi:hypothetical protein ON010_g12276 [Phytophthora cinnamomi]|nr:hypothetical protein ON010_g12276 [Phytophthora cinnamomi]
MSQVSTPSVPERVVEGSNAARRSQQAGLLAVSQRSGIHVTTTLAASVDVTPAAAITDPEPEVSPQQLAPTTRSPTRTPLIPELATAVVWGNMCAIDEGETIDIEDDVAALEECMEEFNPPTDLPTSLAEVEAINSMRFDPIAQCEEPADLFQHADGSTTTRPRPEFKHLFEYSVSASFFAYIPVSFWQQVVGETNSYARVHGIKPKTRFSLEEIMKFIGVLLYMTLDSTTAKFADVAEEVSPSSAVWAAQSRDSESNAGSPQKWCFAVESKQMYSETHRKRQECVVCRWEDRYATDVTGFCVLHGVCLCQHVSATTEPFTCVNPTWTCWEMYHRFYLPHKLFSAKGKVRTSCELYKLKLQAQANQRAEPQDADTTTTPMEGRDDSGARPSVVRMIAL